MKRGFSILTAMLFAGALAVPAMAQSTDTGANKEAPAASAVTNPGTAASDSSAQPSTDGGAMKADENAAKTDSDAMNPEQKPEDASQPKGSEAKPDANTSSDAGTNPGGATGHAVE